MIPFADDAFDLGRECARPVAPARTNRAPLRSRLATLAGRTLAFQPWRDVGRKIAVSPSGHSRTLRDYRQRRRRSSRLPRLFVSSVLTHDVTVAWPPLRAVALPRLRSLLLVRRGSDTVTGGGGDASLDVGFRF